MNVCHLRPCLISAVEVNPIRQTARCTIAVATCVRAVSTLSTLTLTKSNAPACASFCEAAYVSKLVVGLVAWSDVASNLRSKAPRFTDSRARFPSGKARRRVACFDLLYKAAAARALAKFVRVVCTKLPCSAHI